MTSYVLYSGDHALLMYLPHEDGAINDVDSDESFTFYDMKPHLHYESWVQRGVCRFSHVTLNES